MRPLKIGVLLSPQCERQLAGQTASWGDIRELARLSEQVGLDSIWVSDHLLIRTATDVAQGCWECWSILAALAASTTSVTIGSLVSSTSFRNPALLAKIADTVNEISGGRLILGLGAGWVESEHVAFGYPFDHTVARFEEAIAIIASLMHSGRADFRGQYYRVADCELRPRPSPYKQLPIMIGGAGPRMLRVAARYADELNLWPQPTGNTVEGARSLWASAQQACNDVGRDPATLGLSVAVMFDMPGAVGYPGKSLLPPAYSGSPSQLAHIVHEYALAGVSGLQVWLDPMNSIGIQALSSVLTELDRT